MKKLLTLLFLYIFFISNTFAESPSINLSKLKALNSCSACDLTGVDLSGVDLSGADLASAIFTNANLSGVDLSGANLIGVDLSGANLEGAELSGAVFVWHNKRFGSSSGATKYVWSNLSGTNFSNANLSKQNLVQCSSLDGTMR